MKLNLLITTLLLTMATVISAEDNILPDLLGVSIDSLKLIAADLFDDYHFTDNDNTISIQARILFEKPGTYSFILGDVVEKSKQSINGPKGDNGTILFMKFNRAINDGEGFLKSLIWGKGGPTDEHPEEILIKDDILILISFKRSSAMAPQIKELLTKKLEL